MVPKNQQAKERIVVYDKKCCIMDNKQYNEYCRLQEVIRKIGFPQVFDEALASGVKSNKPHFEIACLVTEQDFRLRYDLNFYKLDGSDEYTFDHYKGTFRKEIKIPDVTINKVNTAALEDRMRLVDWNFATQSESSKDIFEATRDQLKDIIDGVMDDLQRLDSTKEGEYIRSLLEAKYLSNTIHVQNTSLQELYNTIDTLYNNTLIFPVREHTPLTTDKAVLILLGEAPMPEHLQKHELYKVFTDGFKLDGVDKLKLGNYFKEIKFFSSLDKAVSHIELIDEKCFKPLDAIFKDADRIIKQAVVIDQLQDRDIAIKLGEWKPNSAKGLASDKIIWELNTNVIPIEEFEKKTGLELSKFGSPNGKGNAFQVFPPLLREEKKDQDLSQKQAKKQVPPRKRRGRGI
jgi:hypothetical protein